jgi:hypothetical protein
MSLTIRKLFLPVAFPMLISLIGSPEHEIITQNNILEHVISDISTDRNECNDSIFKSDGDENP